MQTPLPRMPRLFALGLALVLAACGSAATDTAIRGSGATTVGSTTEATIAAGPVATELPPVLTVEPGTSPVEAATAGPASSPEANSTGAAAASSPFATIAQSQTEEGYWVLGDPAAPALIQFYSDFL
jgi:hypothetical protein